jgi:ABC-2 type transport system permease protein
MPNFRETDPSKIAVGFGGTLNLVSGLLFLLLVIAVMVAPFHVWLSHNQEAWQKPVWTWWLLAGLAAGTALGALAVILPLRLGSRALTRMEF